MSKKFLLSILSFFCIVGIAAAAPLNLPAASPIYFQFNNIEQVNLSNNLAVPGYAPAGGLQGNWGLFNVSSVQNGFALPAPPHNDIAGGPAFFSDDGPGGTSGQITGIFYGINFTSPTTATGGVIDLFWRDAGADTIDASCLAGVGCLPDAAAVARFTSGTFLARLNFEFGIVPGDGTTTLVSNVNPATQGGSGQADSFASVDSSAPGVWTDILDGNWFFVDGPDAGSIRGDSADEFRDVRFSTFFNTTLDSWDDPNDPNTQGVRSNDPGRVLTAVPEPGTIISLGSGLLMLGFVVRRRHRKA